MGSIAYIYSADGVKLTKTVTQAGQAMNTHYRDGFQYIEDDLDFFPHAACLRRGRYDREEDTLEVTQNPNLVNDSYNYIFHYLDHLGNIRIRYAKDTSDDTVKILEEKHYYPFGLQHKGYNQQRSGFRSKALNNTIVLTPIDPFVGSTYTYGFGGKEYDDSFDINTYDFGARNYDPALGRWMNVDPLADQMRRHSPYNFAFDNPVYWTDPDGMAPQDYYIDSATGKLLGQDGASTNNIRTIDASIFNKVSTDNGGTNSENATAELQSQSSIVSVDQSKINSDISTINNETVNDQSAERQLYITLNNVRNDEGNWSKEVTSTIGEAGTDGEASFKTNGPNNNGTRFKNGNIVLAGVHTHNLTSDVGFKNDPGTSDTDRQTAATTGTTQYAVDSYTGIRSTSTSGPSIGRITSDGVRTQSIGTTNSNNIGLNALKIYAGIKE